MRKYLSKLIPLGLFVFLFYSCATREWEEKQEVVGNSFILKEDAFLYTWYEPGQKYVQPPMRTSALPPSIACYEKYGKRWPWSAEARSRGGGGTDREIIGIVRKGTRITVKRVIRRENIEVAGRTVYAVIDDGPFKGEQVQVRSMFENTLNMKKPLEPDARYLAPA